VNRPKVEIEEQIIKAIISKKDSDLIEVEVPLKPGTLEIGVPGPQGPQGLPPDTYVHEQDVPSDTWEVEHNMDKFPSVSIIDSSGRLVIGEVEYVNENKVIVEFTAGFAGKAYLN